MGGGDFSGFSLKCALGYHKNHLIFFFKLRAPALLKVTYYGISSLSYATRSEKKRSKVHHFEENR